MLTSVTPYGLAPLPYWNGADASSMYPPRQLMQTSGVPLIPAHQSKKVEEESSYANTGGKLGVSIASAIVLPVLGMVKAYTNQKPSSRIAHLLRSQEFPVLAIAAVGTPFIGFLEGILAGGLYGLLKEPGQSEGGGE